MLVYCFLKGRRFDINTILLQVAIEEKKKKIKTNKQYFLKNKQSEANLLRVSRTEHVYVSVLKRIKKVLTAGAQFCCNQQKDTCRMLEWGFHFWEHMFCYF